MRQDETKNTDQEAVADEVIAQPGKVTRQDSRRRFVAGAAAAPVLLSVAGRSALATTNCQDIPKGLSPIAWLSAHPKKGTSVCISHAIGSNPLGKSPGYWIPNKNGKCFQGQWPTGTYPFVKCWRIKSTNPTTYEQVSWVASNWNNYTSMLYYYPVNTTTDAGWNGGSKIPWMVDSRSTSKILIDDNGSSPTLNWFFCCAYLNAKTFSNYAITEPELIYLYQNHKMASGSYLLTDDEIKAFLSQTWA